MPLFDKMKEAGKAGQARLEQAQAKRQGDILLRRLGAAVYAQRTGSRAEDDVDELVAAIRAHEAEHGALPATDESAPPAGDFTLE